MSKSYVTWFILIVLIVSLPVAVIYYDYTNDLVHDNNDLVGYETEVNATVPITVLEIGEYPAFTDVNVYINRTSETFDAEIYFYVIEGPQYEAYLTGEVSPKVFTRTEITNETNNFWFNNTLALNGMVRLVVESTNITESNLFTGYYNTQVEGYYTRNLVEINVGITVYILTVFVFVPRGYRRYQVNQFKRQKELERQQEEDDFYRNYNS